LHPHLGSKRIDGKNGSSVSPFRKEKMSARAAFLLHARHNLDIVSSPCYPGEATRPMQVRQTRAMRMLLVGMAGVIALTGVRARAADSAAFQVAMTIDTGLADTARAALVHEVEAIWRDAGVRLIWVDAGDAALRVSVGRRSLASRHDGSWVVGELRRSENGQAVATASVTRAELVLRAAGSSRSHVLPDAVVQHRLGTVLGRAVAHEIGHYLLDSGAHTTHGLMRAAFQPRDFTDLRSGSFELDDESQRRIHERLGARLTTIARADRAPLAGSTRSIRHR
jgi:hypothetical protein